MNPSSCATRGPLWIALVVGLTACATAETPRGPRLTPSRAAQPAAGPQTVPRLDYTVAITRERGGTLASVEVCTSGWRPPILIPGIDAAARALTTEHPVRGEGRIVRAGQPGECTRYAVDLSALAASHARSPNREAIELGDALILTAGLWLWRPPVRPADLRATIRFETEPGVDISAPWPRDGEGRYRLEESAFRWPSRVVIGAFDRLSVRPAGLGVELDVGVLNMPRQCTLPGIERWLAEAAQAVAAAYGRFPVPRVQVIVAPVPWITSEPVTFGMALRGGGPAVVLLLNALAEDGSLPGEWVAIHELFHLGAPPMDPADAWLSEGLTMYYSEVLRGRRGHLDRRATWQALHEGFERGRASGSRRVLWEESRLMRRTAEYRRVYWAGAAVALAWDVALREESAGRVGLDQAIRHLLDCCRDAPRRWPARRVVATLDAWHGSSLFSTLASRYLDQRAFPAIEPLLTRLGVEVDRDGVVRLDDAAPGSAWRDAITDGGVP